MLNLAIIVPNNRCPGWITELAERLRSVPKTRVTLIPVGGRIQISLAARIYLKLVNKLMPGHRGLLAEGPSSNSEPVSGPIDILLDPGFCPDEVLQQWKPAVSYRLMIGTSGALHPLAGLHEWVNGFPVTNARLVNTVNGEIIASGCTRTFLTSYPKHLSRVLCMAINLVQDQFKKRDQPIQPTPANQSVTTNQDTMVLKAFLITFTRSFNKLLRQLLRDDRWLLKTGDEQSWKEKGSSGLRYLESPANTFWADPFMVKQDGKTYLFVEDCPVETGKGHLSCIVLDKDGKQELAGKILDKPYHLSYPNVFRFNDRWYMIPESSANLTIDLYECVEFPFNWRHVRSLLSGIRAFDSTLLWKDGKVWLFCTVCRHEAASPDDDLCIFYSEDLLHGTFIPHRLNPVKSDPYSARPAGAFQCSGETIIRPAQIGVPLYGHALAFNQVLELSETAFNEVTLNNTYPGTGELAVHTLNRAEGEVV
ncbi:MAG: hypothetical protein ACKOAR_03685, partial [Bacteroidota bacterium]